MGHKIINTKKEKKKYSKLKGKVLSCKLCKKKYYCRASAYKKGNSKFCSNQCRTTSGHTAKTKKKLSRASKGRKLTKEHKTKISLGNLKRNEKGERSPIWKGGRFKSKSGYIYIYSPNHPNKLFGNYVAEHRLIMEKHIGRYLTKQEMVHHTNAIKNDNRLSNLRLVTKKVHFGKVECPFCANKFYIR